MRKIIYAYRSRSVSAYPSLIFAGSVKTSPCLFAALLLSCMVSGCGSKKDAAAYETMAKNAYKQKQYAEAIGYLDKAIELKPDAYDLYVKRGSMHALEKRYDKAIENCDSAISLRPDDPELYSSRGQFRVGNKQPMLALEDLDKAISLAPNNGMAYMFRGLAYGTMEQLDKAAENFDKACTLGIKRGCEEFAKLHKKEEPPSQEAVEKASLYFDRGRANFREKKYNEAIPDLTEAISLAPGLYMAHYTRGLAYYQTGQYDPAIRDLSTTIYLKPDFMWAYTTLGGIYNTKRQFDKAIEICGKAAAIDPGFAKNYLMLGIAYDEKKAGKLAYANFKKACELKDKEGCRRAADYK